MRMTEHACEPRRGSARRVSRLVTALTVCAAIAGFPMLAHAQHGDGHGGSEHSGSAHAGGWHGGGGWHGSAHDWSGGHWYHGWNGGRFGWYWYVPGYDWYSYYDAPTYPNPAYPYAGQAPNVWYYCRNPAGYYPYVQQCAGPWQPVPAAAPPG